MAGMDGSMGFRLLALTLLLAGCTAQQAADVTVDAKDEASRAVDDQIQDAQAAATPVTTPVIVAVQQASDIISEALPQPVSRTPTVDPAAVALIVSFEVVSPAYYVKRLTGIICPGGASGPTGGIGYDFGHQTESRIESDWEMRADRDRLATASGQTGPARCRDSRNTLSDVRIPLQQASGVFEGAMLPAYQGAARRAYGGDLFDALPDRARGAMVSEHFNRGGPAPGSRGTEQRFIRDVCIPRGDVGCIAAQLRAMCRIWKGTNLEAGLCRRRDAEARLAES